MESEQKFLKEAKRALDEMEHNLDAGILGRLRVARREAVGQAGSKSALPGWLLPLGGFTAAGIALAVAGLLWLSAPRHPLMPADAGDMELLSAQENPDFFTELEFYEWLETHGNAG